jgi:hypothetical protein
MVFKKLISGVTLIVVLLCMFSGTIWASYVDQFPSFSFAGVNGGYGGVDGSENGVYYSLSSGNVRLDLTNTLTAVPNDWDGTSVNCWVILKREKDWSIDESYGTRTIAYTQSGNDTTSSWTVDTDSHKYYLYVSGGEAGWSYSSVGVLHDHS